MRGGWRLAAVLLNIAFRIVGTLGAFWFVVSIGKWMFTRQSGLEMETGASVIVMALSFIGMLLTEGVE